MLRISREAIKKSNSEFFPRKEIINSFPPHKKLNIPEYLDSIKKLKYNDISEVFFILSLVVTIQGSKKWHIDHIFPKELLKKRGISDDLIDIGNLRLTSEEENLEKFDTPADEWLKAFRRTT